MLQWQQLSVSMMGLISINPTCLKTRANAPFTLDIVYPLIRSLCTLSISSNNS